MTVPPTPELPTGCNFTMAAAGLWYELANGQDDDGTLPYPNTALMLVEISSTVIVAVTALPMRLHQPTMGVWDVTVHSGEEVHGGFVNVVTSDRVVMSRPPCDTMSPCVYV